MKTPTQKLSISLEQPLYEFIDNYQTNHHCKSRSEVISKAISLLQQIQLATYYKEASKELDTAFDVTLFDGLDDETW